MYTDAAPYSARAIRLKACNEDRKKWRSRCARGAAGLVRDNVVPVHTENAASCGLCYTP
jgi:hypothetical protein